MDILRESILLSYPSSSLNVASRFPQPVAEGVKQRLRAPKFQEHYKQAKLFYNSLAPYEKTHLIAATSFELSRCDDPVVPATYIRILNNVDSELASAIAKNVGAKVPEDAPEVTIPPDLVSKPVSQLYFLPKTPTIKSRRIAVLIDDGFNSTVLHSLKKTLEAAQANVFIIGPRRAVIKAETGSGEDVKADHHFQGQRSTLFDAIVVPSGKHGESLSNNGRAVHWVREAFGHCKPIGGIGEGTSSPVHSLLHLLMYVQAPSSSDSAFPCHSWNTPSRMRVLWYLMG